MDQHNFKGWQIRDYENVVLLTAAGKKNVIGSEEGKKKRSGSKEEKTDAMDDLVQSFENVRIPEKIRFGHGRSKR